MQINFLMTLAVDGFLNAQSISIIHCQFYVHSREATSPYYCTRNIIAYLILLLKTINIIVVTEKWDIIMKVNLLDIAAFSIVLLLHASLRRKKENYYGG